MRSPRDHLSTAFALFAVVLAIVLASIAHSIGRGPIAFSWGDGALLEIYTNYAARGIWHLGPHSQYRWNHPGPLLFYLLAPVYKIGQSHAFALNAGALAINVASVLACAWGAVRWAAPMTACAVLLTVGVYIVRVDSVLLISYWNPHVIVLALPAFIVVCAAVGAGYPSALPIAIAVGSFLAQTHVSLVPLVTVLVVAALAGLFSAWRAADRATAFEIRRWLAASVVLFVALWCLPLIEQATGRPGNLAKLIRFFTEPYDSPSWSAAARVWGGAVSMLFAREIQVPVGAAVQLANAPGWIALAITQLVLLVVAGRNAKRRGDRFLYSINWIGAAASLVALWSITRIRTFIGDYMVFWVSAVGALNWGILAAGAWHGSSVAGGPWRAVNRKVATALAVVVVAGVTTNGVRRLWTHVQVPQKGPSQTVATLTAEVEKRLHNDGVESMRPLVCISQAVWSEGAGVVAALHKRGVPLSVDSNWVTFFGSPLAPTGQENSVLQITDASGHLLLATPEDELATSSGGVYIHFTAGFDATNGPHCTP